MRQDGGRNSEFGFFSAFQVYLCGNGAEAKQVVSEVATKLGLSVLDRGSLTAARELEDFPLELFPEWRLPLRLALGLTASFYVYLLLRDVVYAYLVNGKDISFRMMVSLANKVQPVDLLFPSRWHPSHPSFSPFVHPVSGVSYRVPRSPRSLLPARHHCRLSPALQRNQIQVRTSEHAFTGALERLCFKRSGVCLRRFPDWLDRWMLCRKQLGLIALGFACLHVLYTLIIPIRCTAGSRATHTLTRNVRTFGEYVGLPR